ncbi:MAG: class B sortase [Christensenellaceae bacterium]|nr:class B sortase [Christensenellaceae bacterium]
MTRALNRVFDWGLLLLLLTGLLYCGYALWDTRDLYAREAYAREKTQVFKPSEGDEENLSLSEAVALNADVCGWLVIENTRIDYLLVQGNDNQFYLNYDPLRNFSIAGSIFLDHRCKRDFSGFHSILYGHHMSNGSMFSDLEKFGDEAFFNANERGWLHLPGATHRLQILAYLTVDAYDSPVFNPFIESPEERQAFLGYLRENARHLRDTGLDLDAKLLTLSTCSSDFTNARSVLIARIL